MRRNDELRDVSPTNATPCPLFVGRLIRNIRNIASPEWLQRRLTAIGLRPISALVDITNYLTFDCARPLHVFDANKIAGNLWVCSAKGGETFKALDGNDYAMQPGMTIIGDDTGMLSLAGIMGGETSKCEATTTDVLIEAAYFDPVRTARTGRALNLSSDARYRFERGVDPAFTIAGVELATKLVLELCGTPETVVSEVVIAGAVPEPRAPIAFDPRLCVKRTGVDVSTAEQEKILTALGFAITNKPTEQSGSLPLAGRDREGGYRQATTVGLTGDYASEITPPHLTSPARGEEKTALLVTPPSWRPDIEGAADLVEEIIRVKGFDHIQAISLHRPDAVSATAIDLQDQRANATRRALAAQGLMEAVTWSFMPSAIAAHFGGGDAALRLTNPISSDLDALRPSILGNLMLAAKRNADRGFSDVGLFEVGPVFRDVTPEGQSTVAAALRAGSTPRHWAESQRAVDAYDSKADAIAALTAAGAPVASLQVTTDAPAWYHPGRSGALKLGPTVLAYFGEIHPSLLATLDIAMSMAGCEIFFASIPQSRSSGTAKPLLKLEPLQPVLRDFAFVVDEAVTAAKLVKAVRDADKALIRDVTVFDVYAGEHVAFGKKSVALSVTLQPTDKTLTDAEIESIAARITAAVGKATGAVLRG